MTPDHEPKKQDRRKKTRIKVYPEGGLDSIIRAAAMRAQAQKQASKNQEDIEQENPELVQEDEALRLLRLLIPSPLTSSEFDNALMFADTIYESLLTNHKRQVVVDFTEKPGQGKTKIRRAFSTYIDSRQQSDMESNPNVTDEKFKVNLVLDRHGENPVGELIATEIEMEKNLGEDEDYQYSVEYNQLLEVMVDLEPTQPVTDPRLRRHLKNAFDVLNKASLPERYKKEGTHDKKGKHADYPADPDDFLRAARNYLAIQIANKLNAGYRLVLVEHSSGLKIKTKKDMVVELRQYPHDLMAHIKNKKGPFSKSNCPNINNVDRGYCSIVGGLFTVEIMDKFRAALQKAENKEEASEISQAFIGQDIVTVEELIEQTEGGSLPVIILTDMQEKKIIDDYGKELDLDKEYPDLYKLATGLSPEKGVDPEVLKLIKEAEDVEDGDGLSEEMQIIIDIVNKSKNFARFMRSEDDESVASYSALLARKYLVSKIHEEQAEDIEANYEIHVLNEAKLPNTEPTILQLGLIRLMQEEALKIRAQFEEENQPGSV